MCVLYVKVTKTRTLTRPGPRKRKEGKTKYVTGREFYSYQMQQRVGHTNLLLRSKKLFHKYVCDAMSKIEQNELNFHKQDRQQKEYRSESFNILQDALNAGDSLDNYGKKVILPSSFTRGPRHRQQRFQDSMAIVREYGKPDLFITMTANPKWKEITESLLPNQRACHRPDIVNRVFALKVKHLLHLIRKEEVFGKPAAIIWVIEYQKRGMPHIHLLLTLEPKYRIRTAADIDKIIRAEIPDASDEALQHLVLNNMVHGPCGHENLATRAQYCMKDYNTVKNTCGKHFPAPLCKETKFKEDGTYFFLYFLFK